MKNLILCVVSGVLQILCLIGLLACVIRFMTVEADTFYLIMGAAFAVVGLAMTHLSEILEIAEDVGDDTNS